MFLASRCSAVSIALMMPNSMFLPLIFLSLLLFKPTEHYKAFGIFLFCECEFEPIVFTVRALRLMYARGKPGKRPDGD